MASLERIQDTPLAIDVRGDSVRVVVAGDNYTVANISPGMNDRAEYARLFAAALPMMQHLKSARAFLVNDANDSEKNGQPEDAHFVREFIAKIDAVLADATGAV